MLSQEMATQNLQIQIWHIDRFVFYARNPRKNDAAVDRMCSSIGEFGFKIPVLARSDGTVVDGHLRLKAARKLRSWPGGDISTIPVVLCDEWSEAQVKASRLMQWITSGLRGPPSPRTRRENSARMTAYPEVETEGRGGAVQCAEQDGSKGGLHL